MFEKEFLTSLVGMLEKEAVEKVKASGFRCRTVYRNGESFGVTADHRMDRVNFTIIDDKVSKVRIG